jgi:hypothetical protein
VGTPQHIRVALGAFRTMGLPFNVAWTRALNTLPRDDPDRLADLAILEWAKPAYRAGYERADGRIVAKPVEGGTLLAFIGAAVGASDSADPAAVRSITDPAPSPSGAQGAPDAGKSEPVCS